jgi:4-methylaminobutanoate oxidase (formaldehyde-forming)
MAKFVVQGRDAGTFLSRLSTNHVNGACNTIAYTQWLDEDGKMQADVTVIKLSGPEHSARNGTPEEGKFIVIATDTMLRHAEAWMRKHVKRDEHVFIHDVTGAYAQINIQGVWKNDLVDVSILSVCLLAGYIYVIFYSLLLVL